MSGHERTERWLTCEHRGCPAQFGPHAQTFHQLRRAARLAGWQYYWAAGQAVRRDLCPAHKVTP